MSHSCREQSTKIEFLFPDMLPCLFAFMVGRTIKHKHRAAAPIFGLTCKSNCKSAKKCQHYISVGIYLSQCQVNLTIRVKSSDSIDFLYHFNSWVGIFLTPNFPLSVAKVWLRKLSLIDVNDPLTLV